MPIFKLERSFGFIFGLSFSIIAFYLTPSVEAQFVRGGDVSWLPQMEATGYKFYNSAGVETNCLQILKDKGINTVRLRVWVNPSNDKTSGHCSKKETVVLAQRAKAMGMKVMIDFHYSDSWADPSKQNKPAAWVNHSLTQLLDDVYNHTFEVLDTLKQIGVTPEWVQVGNEIAGGMLWPDGKLWGADGSPANWVNLAQMLNKGYDATKAADNSIKVIIHLESGSDNGKFRWFFDNAKNYGVRYDIIGLSYYPYWISDIHPDYTMSIDALGTNLNDMVSRYNKDVMVVEVGGDYTLVQNTYDMLVAVIQKTSAVPGGRGLGVIYWEPEGAKSWSGYQLSCWGADGKPTAALDAFMTSAYGIEELNTSSEFNFYPNPCVDGKLNFEFKSQYKSYELRIFDMNGKLFNHQTLIGKIKNSIQLNLLPGVYFVDIDDGKYSESRKLIIK